MTSLPVITDFSQAGAPRMSGFRFLLASFTLRRGPRNPFARIPAGALVKLNPQFLTAVFTRTAVSPRPALSFWGHLRSRRTISTLTPQPA
jgi:hypothetical protein